MASNNPSMSREIRRRSVPIHLEYDGDPERREFRIPDMQAYVREHRVELVSAVHILVHNWLFGGRPEVREFEEGDVRVVRNRFTPTSNFLASYERWSEVMSGILEAAGVPGFLGGLDEWAAQASPTDRDVGGLLAVMFELTQDALTSREWAERLRQPVEGDGVVARPVELPPLLLEGNGNRDLDQLTLALSNRLFRRYKGQVIDGRRIVEHPGRYNRWSIEEVAETA